MKIVCETGASVKQRGVNLKQGENASLPQRGWTPLLATHLSVNTEDVCKQLNFIY